MSHFIFHRGMASLELGSDVIGLDKKNPICAFLWPSGKLGGSWTWRNLGNEGSESGLQVRKIGLYMGPGEEQ